MSNSSKIERKFNKLSNDRNIKLIKESKNTILSITEFICNKKDVFMIQPI